MRATDADQPHPAQRAGRAELEGFRATVRRFYETEVMPQRERYAAQLDEYAKALGAGKRGLYFPLHKGWREWSD